MPWPEIAYMTNAMTTSCQPRPHPHATGTAAATAMSGTTMKTPRITCSIRARRSVLGTAARGVVSAGFDGRGATAGRGSVVVGAVMQLSFAGDARSSYATVTYGPVTRGVLASVGNVPFVTQVVQGWPRQDPAG